ncbi:SIR2 family protein [bacterium]|nr:SIR2 family protein [bacterium]
MSSNPRKVFLLGAGSSAHSGAPLGKHFLKLVYSDQHKDKRIQNIKTFLEKYFNINKNTEIFPKFEEVLSFIDISLQKGEAFSKDYQEQEILQLRTDLNYLIWKALEFVKNIPGEDTHKLFIQSQLNKNDAIISLNYDTLIDFSLEKSGYNIDYGIPFANKDISTTQSTTKLLKLHGSLNWLYCPGCYSIYHYSYERMNNIFSQEPELCKNDGIYLKGIIIPPTYIKEYLDPFINMIWIKAGNAIRNADEIYFIGCSFSDADMWFKFLLKKSLFLNPNSPDVFVVNPEKRGIIKKRYERILGPVNYIQKTFADWLHDE